MVVPMGVDLVERMAALKAVYLVVRKVKMKVELKAKLQAEQLVAYLVVMLETQQGYEMVA